MRRHLTPLALALVSATTPLPAAAQDDPEAPSLALASDPEPPYWSIAISADPVGAFFGDFALKIDVALGRYHAIYLEPRYFDAYVAGGIGAEVGYRVHPLGEGLSGLFIGPAIGAGALDPAAPRAFLWAGADVGWRFVWGGIVLGASVGVQVGYAFDAQDEAIVAPRVSAELGYAWM
jgi:hypothetical protein